MVIRAIAASVVFGVLFASNAWAVELKEGVEQLATQLSKNTPDQKQLRVAVTDFPDLQGVTSDLGRYIAERLTTRLSQNPRFSVIERRRLGQVLGELKFSMSDLVDPNKAKQLGKMLGVEALVVGSVSDLGNQVDVDARIIEVETSRMLPGASTTISKDQVVGELIQRGKDPMGQGTSLAAPEAKSSAVSRAPRQAATIEETTFELKQCKRSARLVVCHVSVTNNSPKERRIEFGQYSQLWDNAGHNYGCKGIQFGNGRSGGDWTSVGQLLIPGLPMNGALTFEGVVEEANRVTLGVNCGGGDCKMLFRDIALTK